MDWILQSTTEYDKEVNPEPFHCWLTQVFCFVFNGKNLTFLYIIELVVYATWGPLPIGPSPEMQHGDCSLNQQQGAALSSCQYVAGASRLCKLSQSGCGLVSVTLREQLYLKFFCEACHCDPGLLPSCFGISSRSQKGDASVSIQKALTWTRKQTFVIRVF